MNGLAFLAVVIALLTGCSAGATTQTPEVEPAPVLEPVVAKPSTFMINLDSVYRVECGDNVGTAEIVAGNTLLTAHHVIDGAQFCMIGDVKAHIIYDNADLDIAMLQFPTGKEQRYEIDCRGFVTGRVYYAVGHARARDLVVNALIATEDFDNRSDRLTNQRFDHVRVLKGKVYGGMSGGPIVDINGKLVGTVQATSIDGSPEAYSRELRDTHLCAVKS